MSAADRHQIARLVLGEKTPPMAFYESFTFPEKNVNNASVYTINNSNINLQIQGSPCYQEEDIEKHKEMQTNILANDDKADVAPIIDLIKQCGEMYGSSASGIKTLTERLKKIKSKGQWETFLHTTGSSTYNFTPKGCFCNQSATFFLVQKETRCNTGK